MSFFSEFKAFALRGNVMDLAIAFVMGAAFTKIITALVNGIIMPLIGLISGGINLTNYAFVFGHAVIKWGAFLEAIIDFSIIALAIFLAIKLVNSLKRKEEDKPTPELTEIALLSEIRDLLKKSKDLQS